MVLGLLANRYRILDTLGQGGFGKTFLAEDTQMPLPLQCVVKQLTFTSNDAQIDQRIKDLFQQEAAILQHLAKSNDQIPKLYAYFAEGGQLYLVQELVVGQTLEKKMQVEGRLDEQVVKDLLLSLLPVLDFVHSQHKIHRDIKPENIILRQHDNKPVLIDFGAVKEIASTVVGFQGHPPKSIIIGTLPFMAPEQKAGHPVYSSDLYSLALTAICLLTGKTNPEEMADPITGQIVWVKFATSVGQGLVEVLDKAIKVSQYDRYATAGEMYQALFSLNRPVTSLFGSRTPSIGPGEGTTVERFEKPKKEERNDALAANVKTILTIRPPLDKTNKENPNTPDDKLEKHLILSKSTDVISESILTDLIESELIAMLSHGGFTQKAHTEAISTIRQNEALQRRLTTMGVSKLRDLLQPEVSTSFMKGGLDEYVRRRLRDSLSGNVPIVVASSCMMLATIAILYYLKHHEGYNITIAHAYPHAMELASLITAHTVEPDAVVMSLATVPPLVKDKTNYYTPRMLMPPNPHRIVTPHTTKDPPQLSEGEFCFSQDELSTALYEWETLLRNRIVNPDRSRLFHLEPDQVLSDLSDDRNEQKYILWSPIWQLILRLGIGVPVDDKPYWFDAVLFFHERFDRSQASSDLALAIRHTWLELLYDDDARYRAIHYMLGDKDYVDNLMKFTGISDLILLKA